MGGDAAPQSQLLELLQPGHRRYGHLFQGRCKAQLIENEGHYWGGSRYIHLNHVLMTKCARTPTRVVC